MVSHLHNGLSIHTCRQGDWTKDSGTLPTRHVMLQENAARQHDNHTHQHQFDVNIASALAHMNSIAYCNHNNVKHWNCTRCAVLQAVE